MAVVTDEANVFFKPRKLTVVRGNDYSALGIHGCLESAGEEVTSYVLLSYDGKLFKLLNKFLPRLHRMEHQTTVETLADHEGLSKLLSQLNGNKESALCVNAVSVFANEQNSHSLSEKSVIFGGSVGKNFQQVPLSPTEVFLL